MPIPKLNTYQAHGWQLELFRMGASNSSYRITTPYGLRFQVKPVGENLEVHVRTPCCNWPYSRPTIEELDGTGAASTARVRCLSCQANPIDCTDQSIVDRMDWTPGNPAPSNLKALLDATLDPLTATLELGTLTMLLEVVWNQNHGWIHGAAMPLTTWRVRGLRTFMKNELGEDPQWDAAN